MPMNVDPHEFVLIALSDLPADPADTTAEDLQTLLALNEGFMRYVEPIHSDWRAARDRIRGGEGGREDLREFLWLETLMQRCRLADELLTTYTVVA